MGSAVLRRTCRISPANRHPRAKCSKQWLASLKASRSTAPPLRSPDPPKAENRTSFRESGRVGSAGREPCGGDWPWNMAWTRPETNLSERSRFPVATRIDQVVNQPPPHLNSRCSQAPGHCADVPMVLKEKLDQLFALRLLPRRWGGTV